MTIFYLVCVLTQNNGFSTTKKVTFCVLEIGGEWMESQLLDAVQKNTFFGGYFLNGQLWKPLCYKEQSNPCRFIIFSVSSQFLEVGMAVRPTAALLNHSCWPNTVRCSRGGAVVLMAARDIRPGEEVTKTLNLVCQLWLKYFFLLLDQWDIVIQWRTSLVQKNNDTKIQGWFGKTDLLLTTTPEKAGGAEIDSSWVATMTLSSPPGDWYLYRKLLRSNKRWEEEQMSQVQVWLSNLSYILLCNWKENT